MRAVELDERLATEQRGHWTAAELLDAATDHGHASLGWDDAGAIAVGQRADLVTLDTASARTAGTGPTSTPRCSPPPPPTSPTSWSTAEVVVRQGDAERGRAAS